MYNPKPKRTGWHSSFFEAIQLELKEYKQYLEFIYEYNLTTEPLRIDVLIIRKTTDFSIEKNIAQIFRKDNIVEYKNPNDYISIDDFYKVYAYACLYKILNKLDINDITITFVSSRYPRELLGHLQKVRNLKVEEKVTGIYNITGDIFPIQIIDNRKLSVDENNWLRDLYCNLSVNELYRMTEKIARLGKK